MSDLHKLLERVKAALGADRGLDADLAEAFGIRVERERWSQYTQEWAPIIYDWMGCAKHPLPPLTSSIDAALALVERMLPGAEYEITTLYGVAAVALPLNGESLSYGRREDCNVPLAIIAALLTALIAQEPRQSTREE